MTEACAFKGNGCRKRVGVTAVKENNDESDKRGAGETELESTAHVILSNFAAAAVVVPMFMTTTKG